MSEPRFWDPQGLAALRRRVELFGFHPAELEVRVHARDAREPDERIRSLLAASSSGFTTSGTRSSRERSTPDCLCPR